MNYLLIEPKVKAIAPNIALMKWARWCEDNGHNYQYVRGIVKPDIPHPDKILMSCIFSYHSENYEHTINHYRKLYPWAEIIIGGVFPSLYPHWFKGKWPKIIPDAAQLNIHCGLHGDIENLAPKYNVEITSQDKNPYSRDKIVLYASRGCPNKCGYCAVPKLEGDMKSFKSIRHMLDAGVINYMGDVV